MDGGGREPDNKRFMIGLSEPAPANRHSNSTAGTNSSKHSAPPAGFCDHRMWAICRAWVSLRFGGTGPSLSASSAKREGLPWRVGFMWGYGSNGGYRGCGLPKFYLQTRVTSVLRGESLSVGKKSNLREVLGHS